MKVLLLSVTSVLMCCLVFAQPKNTNKPKDKLREAIYADLLKGGTPELAAKPTSTTTDERLVGQTTRTWVDPGTGVLVWLPYDSFDHRYSAERGSTFNFNVMDFIKQYNIYSTDFMGQGIYIGFQNRDNKMGLLSDSSREYFWDTTLKLYYVYSYQYNSQNNIAVRNTRDVMTAYREQFDIAYNAADRPALVTLSSDAGAGWDTFSYRFMNYTGDSITFDSSSYKDLGVWHPQSTYTYTYNANGTLAMAVCANYDVPTATWYDARKYTLEYYTSGKIKKMTIEIAGPSNPYQILQVDSFGWNAAGYADMAIYRYYPFGTPTFQEIYSKHVGVGMLPDTTFYTYNDLVTPEPMNDRMTTWNYDSYNNPTLATTYIRSSATAGYDSVLTEVKYYYETYTRDNSSVPAIGQAASFSVYPNPVTGYFTIDQAGTAVANICVYNMAGQRVLNTAVAAGSTVINAEQLSAGVYIIAGFKANGEPEGSCTINKL